MAKKAKKKGGSKAGAQYVVGSKVKDALRKSGCRTAGDALDSLNGHVAWLIEMAAKRAKANKRQTVRGEDF